MIQITRPSFGQPKVLVYGPPGRGKTYLMGTLQDDPRTSPVLFLDCEGGTSTLFGKEIDLVEVRGMKDLEQVLDFLEEGNHPYRSVVLDSLTEVQLSALLSLHSLGEQEKRRKLIAALGYDPEVVKSWLEPQDYGVALSLMRRLLRRFRNLDLPFFATALSKEASRGEVVPALVGALAEEVGGFFDVVAYLALEEEGEEKVIQRKLLVGAMPGFYTKIRVPPSWQVPTLIPGNSISSLLDYLTGGE